MLFADCELPHRRRDRRHRCRRRLILVCLAYLAATSAPLILSSQRTILTLGTIVLAHFQSRRKTGLDEDNLLRFHT